MSRWRPDRNSSAQSQPLALGLSGEGCALWLEAEGRLLEKSWPLASPQWTADQVSATLMELTASAQKWGARSAELWIAEELSRYWMVQPPTRTRSLAELQAVAIVRGAQIFGGLAGKGNALNGWRVEADWNASHEFLCAALPEALLQGVEQWLKWTRLSLVPRLSASLLHLLAAQRSKLPRNAWLCVTWPERTHLLLLQQGRITALRSLSPAAADSTQDRLQRAVEELRRECLRLGAAASLPILWVQRNTASNDAKERVVIEVASEAFVLERLTPLSRRADSPASSGVGLASRYALLASDLSEAKP